MSVEELHLLLKNGTDSEFCDYLVFFQSFHELLNKLVAENDVASLERLDSGKCGYPKGTVALQGFQLISHILDYSAISVLSWWASHPCDYLERDYMTWMVEGAIRVQNTEILEWFLTWQRARSSLTVHKLEGLNELLWSRALRSRNWAVIRWLRQKEVPIPRGIEGAVDTQSCYT